MTRKAKQLLSKDHPETLNSRNNWAMALGSTGKHEEALKLKREVRRIRKKLFGKDHPDTVDVLNSIAWSLYSLGRAEEGVPYVEKLLAFLSNRELKTQNRIRRLDTAALIFANVRRLQEAKDIALRTLAESEENYSGFDDFMGERYQTAAIVSDKMGKKTPPSDTFNKPSNASKKPDGRKRRWRNVRHGLINMRTDKRKMVKGMNISVGKVTEKRRSSGVFPCYITFF